MWKPWRLKCPIEAIGTAQKIALSARCAHPNRRRDIAAFEILYESPILAHPLTIRPRYPHMWWVPLPIDTNS